jgi:hypothetical protein
MTQDCFALSPYLFGAWSAVLVAALCLLVANWLGRKL